MTLLARPQRDANPAQSLAVEAAPPQITAPWGGGGCEYGAESETVVRDGWTARPGANNLSQRPRCFNFRLACRPWFTTDGDARAVNEYR